MSVLRHLALLLAAALAVSAARAQPQQGPQPASAADFLIGAYSIAAVQARAAGIVGERQARDEAKQLAAAQAAFRGAQLPRIAALAQQAKVTLPMEPTQEQAAILENMAPLDVLALSRRYAEFQQQALEREVQAYEIGARLDDEAVRSFAAAALPRLREQLEQARKVSTAVGP